MLKKLLAQNPDLKQLVFVVNINNEQDNNDTKNIKAEINDTN